MSKPCSGSRVGCKEEGEPALWLVLKESEAKKVVAAVENGHAYAVVAILKNQPWWPELSAAVRRLPCSGSRVGCDAIELNEFYGHYE